jgi:AcrR family transcriptional regulator
MVRTQKLSGEERRAAIIQAVRRLFADKGFHGTTTRELADAAGVSEALLFKHFPNKEALFTAMKLSCCNQQEHERYQRLTALEPSASTLVLLVHFLVSQQVRCVATDDDERAIQNRLMLRSLAEDGDFARLLLRGLAADFVPKIEACCRAAVAAGDAFDGPVSANLGGWFVQHLAAMIQWQRLPAEPVVDYALSRDQLVEQTVWFILRGVGLKEESIRRYYNPRALALFDS